VREQINAVLRTMIFGMIAASAGATAFLFAVVAAFLWVQQHYDTIIAAGVVGGMFLLVAVIALIALAISRRRAARAERRAAEAANANSLPAWLTDPALLLTAFQVVRTIGFGRLIPIALAGVAAFGAAGLMGGKKTSQRKTTSNETKRAA
jgi:hypothetical protein